jgi:hypothetical protein
VKNNHTDTAEAPLELALPLSRLDCVRRNVQTSLHAHDGKQYVNPVTIPCEGLANLTCLTYKCAALDLDFEPFGEKIEGGQGGHASFIASR